MVRLRDKSKEEAIKSHALEIIVKEGFDGLSMHKLAKAAGVSPATIYIYFKDRDDLILQLALEEETKMFEATLLNFDPEMSFEEGLKTQWHNRASYFLENPNRMQFLEQLKYSPFHEQIVSQSKGNYGEIMRGFVKRAIRNKELEELPLEVYWSMAFVPLYQLIKFHIHKKGMDGKPFTLTEKTLEQSLQLVLKALRPV